MSDLTCWNCKKAVSFYERRENDGDCPHCNHYIDLETTIDKLKEELSNNSELDELLDWAFNNHVQVAQYGTWYGTYTGNERPAGSNGCVSYEQTFLAALRQAQVTLGV